LTGIDFRRIFEQGPGLILLLTPDASFTIVGVSDAYLRATYTTREEILGRPLFDVFPEPPDAPDFPHHSCIANLRVSLARVLATREADTMTEQRYDLRQPAREGGVLEEHWWSPVNTPVLSDAGAIACIVHRVEDATTLVRAREIEEDEREKLVAAESEQQRRVYETALSNTPDLVFIFDRDHRFTYANAALLKMWGKTREEAVGRTCIELGYEPWHAEMHDREIETVVATRAPIRGEVPFSGTSGRRVYDYIFVPVMGPDGDVIAVAGTTRDVTERQHAEQSIREQAERLRESDRAKDEFLATLAHELRNPLAPLRNSLSLLEMAAPGDARTAPIRQMMERQVNHLVRLVDDLLEMSRVSRGTFALRKERVDVATVVRNAVETSEPLIRAAGHRLEIALPDEPLWLEGDPVRLAQILANLLNNAAIYTDDGGRISVRASRDGDSAIIAVRDNGVGIAPEALPRMFLMFSRGARSSARAQGGLGIGLALARRLAEMHGGTLDAQSAGPGQGSEFTVRLPMSDAPAPETGMHDPAAAFLTQQRILVVDDNRDAADSLGMILRFIGADVRIAHDGPEALEVFPAYNPAVVFLDIGMPGMDGYEVARALRTHYPDRSTAIVAFTGWGQVEDRRRAQEAGFDHLLVKPTGIDELQSLLRSFADRSAKRRLTEP
jgi:PAS domain S-box-containing protein